MAEPHDPLKPHVLNNLAHRAQHGIPHHVSLPAEMLMALIEEVRASRAKEARNITVGRSRVVIVPDIADVAAPTVAELAAGTPVVGVEGVTPSPPEGLRYAHRTTVQQKAEEALWQRLRDEGGKMVDEHGNVIAIIEPAKPAPDDPWGFVAALSIPAPAEDDETPETEEQTDGR